MKKLLLAFALAWFLFGCASVAPFPHVPAGAPLLNIYPIRCGNTILAMKVYDTNPGTKAGVGVLTDPKGNIVLVIVADDNGEVFVYVRSADGGIRKMSQAEWQAAGLDFCSVFETRQAEGR